MTTDIRTDPSDFRKNNALVRATDITLWNIIDAVNPETYEDLKTDDYVNFKKLMIIWF